MGKTPKKFKAVELNAIDVPWQTKEEKDILWEGEEVTAESTTQITEDKGTGQAIVLRFFEFGANPEVFKQHKPTAQELFNSHIRGMESLLWRDGLRRFEGSEPRLMFSKDKTRYRFIVPCIYAMNRVATGDHKTLSQLLTNDTRANTV